MERGDGFGRGVPASRIGAGCSVSTGGERDGYDKKAGVVDLGEPEQRDRWRRRRPPPVPCRSGRGCGRPRSAGRAGCRGYGAGRATEHGDQPAARFRPERRAERLFLGCGRHRGRSVLQWPRAAERAHSAPVDRGVVGRGPGVELRGTLPALERHPQQPANALDRGRRPRVRLSDAFEQQQRQHVRLPGPAALLRASDPARRPLRARRLDHGARRLLQGQAAQLAQ